MGWFVLPRLVSPIAESAAENVDDGFRFYIATRRSNSRCSLVLSSLASSSFGVNLDVRSLLVLIHWVFVSITRFLDLGYTTPLRLVIMLLAKIIDNV